MIFRFNVRFKNQDSTIWPTTQVPTLQSPIVVQDIQLFMDHLVRPRQLIRAYPFMKKENFHPRQDVYYKNYTKLLSNISKTYHSKTFIVTIYFQDVYIFKKFPFNTSYHVLDYYHRLQSRYINRTCLSRKCSIKVLVS